MRLPITALLLMMVCPGTRAEEILLSNALVLAEDGNRLLPDACVLIADQRIKAVGPCKEVTASSSVQRIDLQGLTLIPGLIDLHSHLLLHPYDEAAWNDQVLKESLELRTIRAVVAARRTLESGFTTLRDLGTEGAGFADVALRDAIATGLIPGPRIFATTRALVATYCYGPSGFDPRWRVPQGAQEVTGVDEARRAVREQIAAGADWIKVYADYHRGDGPTTPTFSQEELNAIVDEAKSAGMKVCAHATIDEGIRRAVLAGAATIEHGYEASEKILLLMRERNVVLCPTLAAVEAMQKYDAISPSAKPRDRIGPAKAMFRRALRAGVTIACGSDAGVFAHGANARELELMVESGMTPAEALRAATATAAKVLQRENDLGRISPGYVADLVAIVGNPLENISTCRNVAMVIQNGKIVVDRRAGSR